MPRLLIQACSQMKSDAPGLVQAIERYTGISYKIIKKYLRENPRPDSDLKIIILSAKYGLISSEDLSAE